MTVRAVAKNVRVAPRKVRLVLNQVRGKSVEQAQRILAFMPNKGAEPVLKLINSAAANAEHNYKLDRKNLVISEIRADMGFAIKRYRPRAFGRAAGIRKETSHLVVTLSEKPSTEKKPTAAKGAAAKGKATAKKPASAKQPAAAKKPTTAKKPAAKKPAPKK